MTSRDWVESGGDATPSDRPDPPSEPPSDLPDEYETIFRTVDDAVFLVGVDGVAPADTYRYRRVNPAYESLTERSASEILNRTPREVFGESLGSDIAAQYRRCVETGETVEYEETLSFPADRRTFETKLTPIRPDGEVTRIVGISRDITERRARERELERNRDLRSKTERLARVGGWELDRRADALRWTDGTRSIFAVDDGYEPTLADAVEFYHPDDRSRIRRLVRRCCEDETPYDVVLRARTAAGDDRWIRSVGEPVSSDRESAVGDATGPGADGTSGTAAVRGAVMDVTERRSRERDRRMFEKAVEQAGHGIVITDPEGTIEYVNPAYAADTGYDRQEAVGLNPRIVKSGKHDDEFYDELWETILAGETWEAEIVNRRKSGELYHVDQTIAPIADDGEITHFVGIESETTDRNLREQRLNVLNRILRHNLRNAMTVVSGHASALRRELDDEELRAHATTIEEWADDLTATGEKVATTRSLFERERDPDAVCDARETLSTVADEFAERYPDAEIAVEAPASLRVSADDRLAVALRELVDNALAHHDRVPPAVTLGATSVGGGAAGWADITVVDTGPGIPGSERAAIEAGEETQVTHGTGIGLWLARWVVAGFGGELSIEDNDPRGTVVRLRLPVPTDEA
ncbi:signal-transducing histidine kinase/response regulator [Halosimplex carlsbadense 2-9-1]|uniref:histidine kinase n=1 Tax=Halosimplex carlsbadense 2-9-1 TaxID=797114 RepID=M0D4H2_9EURY|nr:PAS domain S-box protein [Halosimplex carlsbadense]ELZ29753.1 signal-transducing histidine kinase/response regulator [Halosimplex carlsbadense 2-9-1]